MCKQPSPRAWGCRNELSLARAIMSAQSMSLLAPWIQSSFDALRSRALSGKLPHAMSITGAAGLGKRELASQFAHWLLCANRANQAQACGHCRDCVWIKAGSHPDLLQIGIEEEASQIKIDQVRALCNRLNLRANSGGHQVAIIDPADQMGIEAYNALLKTLEEPTDGSVVILIADQQSRLPATIRSRCQNIAISLPDAESASAWLMALGESAIDVGAALKLCGNNPGAAKTVLAHGGLKTIEQWAQHLADLFKGKVSPMQLAQNLLQSEHAAMHLAWLNQALGLCHRGFSESKAWRDLEPMIQAIDAHAFAAWWDRLNRLRESLRAPLRHDLTLVESFRDLLDLTQAAQVRSRTGAMG